MHDVSNAINILDPSKGIDKEICKKAFEASGGSSDQTKCGWAHSGTPAGLSAWFDDTNNTDWKTPEKKAEPWGERNAKVVSQDTVTNLNRNQKGVVSSAFAKAHEGAEIVEIRSISTTSVMVNACLLQAE